MTELKPKRRVYRSPVRYAVGFVIAVLVAMWWFGQQTQPEPEPPGRWSLPAPPPAETAGVGPSPVVEFVYEENAPYGAFPIGAMVDGEFWLECSETNGVPPCWTFGTIEGTLYWPDGRISRF